MALHAVPNSPDDNYRSTPSGIPNFEGQSVERTMFKLSSVSKLEAGDDIAHIDDTVRLYVEGRVTRIDHVVDEPTGQLVRVHTVKVVDAIQVPWNTDAGQFDR